MALAILFTAILFIDCSSTPESSPSLANVNDFQVEDRQAVKAVVASLLIEGENPAEFRAEIEGPQNGTLTFHLWHQSAFRPENRNVVGNPGGRCRDVKIDLKSNRVISTVLRQCPPA